MRSHYRCRDGSSLPFESTRHVFRSGDSWLVAVISRDIRERIASEQALQEGEAGVKRLNRVYAVLSGINSLIVRVRDRQELFQESCRLAVDAGGFASAWIAMVDKQAMRLKPVAWQGGGREFIDRIPLELNPAGPMFGLAGQAIVERRAIIVEDMATDPRILLKEEARKRGFHSLVMLPLIVAGEPVALLALYAVEVGFFDEGEMKLLRELAADIAFALEHMAKTDRLEYLAFHDSLTGLANRALLMERLAQAVSTAGREQRKFALAIVDIERFKIINDTLGRQAGDALLGQMAERLTELAGDSNRIARLSADHFAVMIPEVADEAKVARIIEKGGAQVESAPFVIAGTELRVAVRSGIAMFPNDGAEADVLFNNAEAALKNAKARGEKYLFYAQQMTERVAGKLSLENKLRLALDNEQFVLHYQPKVELESRGIVGLEALIRWQSPELGLVPPMKFLPLLEETGLILPVGAWALKRATLDHRNWVEQGLKPPRVAVNVSTIQLRQRDFVGILEQAIMEGVAPTGLDLEITESLIMEDVQHTIEKLLEVRKLGIGIAIDDFGTGYSSLSYLARLPVSTLKIDRSFIITMLENPDATTLIQTIISMAHSLRLKVVAEGVETEEQATMLKLLRCDQMQGYLFSKPLPLEEVTALLLRSRPA
jgi:diguanylate cyclase (GGDEF)-like protein